VLYKVRFEQRVLWTKYKGPPTDKLEADIYEQWLLPAKTTTKKKVAKP
jgi:Nitrile hydratase beta subunit